MKSSVTFGGATHTCPVCGERGPCIHSTSTIVPGRVHNCNLCGSTWRDSEVQEPIEETTGLVSLI